MYDILLKGGNIVDPSRGIHRVGSVAILDGEISKVGEDLPNPEARKVFNMEGKIICPGLIDIHCHPAAGLTWLGVPPDEIGLNNGVTLLCDAGSSGSANFEAMRRFVVEPAKTDIFCFLNLSNTGLITLPEIWDDCYLDIDSSKRIIEANTDLIKGIKVRAVQALAEKLGLKGIEFAKKLANDFGMPLMMHLGETRDRVPDDKLDDFSRAAVSLLEEGDILSHYLTWEPGGLILKDGTVYPELEAAKERGVILDACHGLNHFSFTVARHAIAGGFLPTVISTDLASPNWPVTQSLAVVMSKFLNMGLSLNQVIEMTTINPAKALNEEGERGSLMPGTIADITVLELVRGEFLFVDGAGGERLAGDVLMEPRMVLKAGEVMPAFSGYHIPPGFENNRSEL